MKITELRTLDQYERQTSILGEWETISKLMRKHGFEESGRGRLAMVFYHPTRDIVIKIFKTDDADYKKWVDFSNNNKSNPYCPRLGKVVRLSRRYSFIRIESLDNMQTDEDQLFVYEIKDKLAGRKPMGDDQHLNDVLNWIKTFHLDDITWNNIMKRGDQYVFTDPV